MSTVKQEAVLLTVARLTAENGYHPSVAEVAAAIGLGRTATFAHLNRLRDQGRVALDRRLSGWRVTETETAPD